MANINELERKIRNSGMTRKQIADAWGITLSTLSRKLSNKIKISTVEAEKVSTILNLSPQEYREIFFCDKVAR